MKIRQGFVSNSSSSSFTCGVCGNTESGMDVGLEEAGMCRCPEEHIFCNSHAIFKDDNLSLAKKKKIIKDCTWDAEELDSDEAIEDAWECFKDRNGGDVPFQFCPVCNFEKYDTELILNYLLRKNKLTKDQVLGQIKAQFKSFQAYKSFVFPKKD